MINIRSDGEINKIRSACRLAAEAMEIVREEIEPGITTMEISEKVKSFIESHDAKAAFLGYKGFPGAICISINDEVVHGIPGKRVLRKGDIIKIDLGTYLHGFYGDMARTFPVGEISVEAAELMKTTEQSLYDGIDQAVTRNRVGNIGHAVQQCVEKRGYSVVRDLVGHGIGRNLWEEPQIPNYGRPGTGATLKSGMVIAIEPMINIGTFEIKTLDDKWTVVTADGKLSAHLENTCVVRDGFPEILTLITGEEKWQKRTQ